MIRVRGGEPGVVTATHGKSITQVSGPDSHDLCYSQSDSLRSSHRCPLPVSLAGCAAPHTATGSIPSGFQRLPEGRRVTDMARCACSLSSLIYVLPNKTSKEYVTAR